MEIHLAEHADSALRCAVCHDAVRHFRATCPDCATVLHFSCRATLRRCPTLGCAATWPTISVVPRVRVRARSATLGLAVGAWAHSAVSRLRPCLTAAREGVTLCPTPRARRNLPLVIALLSLATSAVVAAIVIPHPRQPVETRVWQDLIQLETAVRHERRRINLPPPDLRFVGSPRDPWGNPYVYRHHAGSVYELLSYGADGLPGGTGDAADVVLRRGFERPGGQRGLDLAVVPGQPESTPAVPWWEGIEPTGDLVIPSGCALPPSESCIPDELLLDVPDDAGR